MTALRSPLGRKSAVGVALTILACFALTSAGFGRPFNGKVQPAALSFGHVQVGSTVEGSVRILKDGEDRTGLSVHVEPPRFVAVKSIEVGTQTYGQFGTKIYCDISMTVATEQPGEKRGALHVKIGGLAVEVPVHATVLPKDESSKRMLVVASPFQKFSTEDPSHFAAWLKLVESAGLAPSYIEVVRGHPILRDIDLSEFEVVLLGQEALVFMRDEDAKDLEQFVRDGGRLVLFADSFFRGTVDGANRLLASSGLRMLDTEYGSVETREYEARDATITDDRFTENVQLVRFFRPAPVQVTNLAAKILVDAPFPGQGFVGIARLGKGELIAVGQSLWWAWIGDGRFRGTDNQQLFRNILTLPATD